MDNLNLQEDLLVGKIDIISFCDLVIERADLHSEIGEKLESNLFLLKLNQKAFEFSDIIFQILDLSYSYDPDEPNLEVAEKNFRKSIQQTYLQTQEILKNEKSNRRYSSNFRELLDQLNWENKNLYLEYLEEFLDDSSNFLNFEQKYQSSVKIAKELESNSIFLELNYQALGFSNLILILVQLFKAYQIDSRMSPKVFKSWIQKILIEIKNY